MNSGCNFFNEKRCNNVTVKIFACATKGECSQSFREAIRIYIVDRRMHRQSHAQERSKSLIKIAVQLIRYENMIVLML